MSVSLGIDLPEDTQTATKKQSGLWTIPAEWSGVSGGISNTSDGALAWGRASEQEIIASRLKWAKRVQIDPQRVVTLEQVHGNNIVRISDVQDGSGFLSQNTRIRSKDGAITNEVDVVLATSHADCASIYMFCPSVRAIGMIHAGWRGTLAGIAANAVNEMCREFSTLPSKILVAIGPTITTRNYQVGDDVSAQFQSRFGRTVIAEYENKPHLDIFASLVIDLLRAGVTSARFCQRPPDTFSNHCWSSYRRDGEQAGGMIAYLKLI